MNQVLDRLRQSSKGQLVYNREIEGKELADLLHKCAAVPLLSSPHIEISPPRLGHSASFGLSPGEDSEEEEKIHIGLCLIDDQYKKDKEDCECGGGEKGEQDSLEREVSSDGERDGKHGSHHQHSPWVIGAQVQSLRSPQSPKVTSRSPGHVAQQILHDFSPIGPQAAKSQPIITPKSPHALSPKRLLVTSPQSQQAISPASPQGNCSKGPGFANSKTIQVMKSPDASVPNADSGRAVEKPEDWAASHCPVATPHMKHILDTDVQGESRLKETCDEEQEATGNTAQEELTVSLPFIEKLHEITGMEMDYDNQLKEVVEKKKQEFVQHWVQLDSWQEELVSVVDRQRLQEIHLLQDSIEKKQQSRRQEVHQAVQKVKESHQNCSLRQVSRLQKVEQLSQHLREERAKRVQAQEQKLGEVQVMAQKITATKTTLVNTLDQCLHKQYLSEVAEKTKLLVRKLSEQAEALAGSLTRDGPLDEVLLKLKHFHEQSQNALDFANNLTVEAEKKARAAAAEAERQRAQAAVAAVQPPQPGEGTSTSRAGQMPSASQLVQAGEEGALAAVVKEYDKNVILLSRTDASLDSFVSNQQMKKMRFDLQRAVNTPVNSISPISSAHLRDKLMRLHSLLKGETVEVLGKRVTAQAAPQGIIFCKNLVAKMIARKGDEQVSSNHESAFAIAAVAVGLWTEFPDVGGLILAHLQALCPYVLPFYPARLPNQSSEDYHKTLGYKIENRTIEQQDKFLRRMSGILRLYAAILVTSPPQGPNHAHPHGLEHAWVWLTRSLNLQPNPDITATAIYDILSVTGSFLLQAYRVQFVKLLYFLFKGFLPKLKDVAAGSGPVIRLETFLETTMKNNARIPQPDGYLPPQFWHS